MTQRQWHTRRRTVRHRASSAHTILRVATRLIAAARRAVTPLLPALLLCTILFSTLAFAAHANASVTHKWSAAFGDVRNNDYGASVSTDAAGNLLFAGAFQGIVDFGGGPLTSDGEIGWRDIILAKFDAAGNHLWSRRFGGPRDDWATAGLADPWGNVILAGGAWGTLDFGGGPIGLAGKYNVILAKFDDTGNHVWSRAFGNDVSYDPVLVDAAAIDDAGSIFLVGRFKGPVSMGGDLLSSADGAVYLARYDADGAHLWSTQFRDSIEVNGSIALASAGVDVDDTGNVFVTASDGITLTLSQYDTIGVEVWSQHFTPSGFSRHATTAADGYGNVYVTGMFGGELDLGGMPLISDEWGSVFVAEFAGQGGHLWSRAFSGGLNQDSGRSACVDTFGNVIVAGTMNGSISFGGDMLTSAGGIDAFLVKFGGDGDHMWSDSYGGSGHDGPLGMHLDPRGRVYLTGAFQDRVSFGGDPLVSAGRSDIFVARFDADAINFFNAHAAIDAIHIYADVGSDLGIDAVEIHRADASGPFSLLRSVPHTGGWLHYEDRDFTPGRMYRYRIRLATIYGEYFSTALTLNTTRFTTALLPNAPNPFNPGTTIRYELEVSGPITLSIYDVRGRRITTLIDDVQSAGPHSIQWNGTNAAGASVGSGVYFCRLESGSGVQSHRMVLVK